MATSKRLLFVQKQIWPTWKCILKHAESSLRTFHYTDLIYMFQKTPKRERERMEGWKWSTEGSDKSSSTFWVWRSVVSLRRDESPSSEKRTNENKKTKAIKWNNETEGPFPFSPPPPPPSSFLAILDGGYIWGLMAWRDGGMEGWRDEEWENVPPGGLWGVRSYSGKLKTSPRLFITLSFSRILPSPLFHFQLLSFLPSLYVLLLFYVSCGSVDEHVVLPAPRLPPQVVNLVLMMIRNGRISSNGDF